MKKNRPIVVLLVLGLCFAGYLCFSYLSFSGLFDKKYTREELTKEFTDHEKEFADLAAFFVAAIPKERAQKITFGLGKGNKVSLSIFPATISPGKEIIGGTDLKIGTSELDPALRSLGWTNGTLKTLREKLSKTNCDWITTTGFSNNIIAYPDQSGWQQYAYCIFEKPVADSIVTTYGRPLSNSEFGKRVVLSYHSAL